MDVVTSLINLPKSTSPKMSASAAVEKLVMPPALGGACTTLLESSSELEALNKAFLDFYVDDVLDPDRPFLYCPKKEDGVNPHFFYMGGYSQSDEFPQPWGEIKFKEFSRSEKEIVRDVLDDFSQKFQEAGIPRAFVETTDPHVAHVMVGRYKNYDSGDSVAGVFRESTFSYGDEVLGAKHMAAATKSNSVTSDLMRHEIGHLISRHGHPQDFGFIDPPKFLTCGDSTEKLSQLLLQDFLCANSDMVYEKYCVDLERPDVVGAFDVDSMAINTFKNTTRLKQETAQKMLAYQTDRLKYLYSRPVFTNAVLGVALMLPVLRSVSRHLVFYGARREITRDTRCRNFAEGFAGALQGGGLIGIFSLFQNTISEYQMISLYTSTVAQYGFLGATPRRALGNLAMTFGSIGLVESVMNRDRGGFASSLFIVAASTAVTCGINAIASRLYPDANIDSPGTDSSILSFVSKRAGDIDKQVAHYLNPYHSIKALASFFSREPSDAEQEYEPTQDSLGAVSQSADELEAHEAPENPERTYFDWIRERLSPPRIAPDTPDGVECSDVVLQDIAPHSAAEV